MALSSFCVKTQTERPPLPAGFWPRVDYRGLRRCWVWQGQKNAAGYGRMKWAGRRWSVHRFLYEVTVGPIPEGMEVDHLCRNPACCNPAHLEPVTGAENKRRARAARGAA